MARADGDREAKRQRRQDKLREPTVARINIRAIARKHGPAAIEALARIMQDEKIEPRSRVAAAREILDRGYGRATFYVEASAADENGALSAANEFARRIASLAARDRPRDAGAVGGPADS